MQADAFLFQLLVDPGDAVVVESPTYDRTLLNLRNRGADIHMVELETDGIDTAALAALLAGGVRPKLAHIIPNFQNPAGYTLERGEARGAAAARGRARLHALRGRPVHRDPLRGRVAADDALAGRRGQGRLRVVVLQDGLPRHPRRLPRRAAGGDQADPGDRDEHLHLAEHGRPVDREPVRPLGADGRRDRDRQGRAARAARRAGRRARARAARGALLARRRAATSCGSSCPRASTSPSSRPRPRSAASLFVKGTDFLLEGGENTLRLAYSGVTPEQIDEGVTRLAEAARSLGVACLSGIAYGRARSQFGELFRPRGDGPHPVAVVLHGGFWRARYGRKLMRPLCARPRRARVGGVERRVPAAGRAAAAARARSRTSPRRSTTSPSSRSPAGVLDLGARASAIGALRRRPPRGVAGTARRPRRVPVTGVVARPGCSTCGWRRSCGSRGGVVHRLLGGTPEERPERYAAASPAERLPLGVPALLTHGGRDDIVPPVMSERFADGGAGGRRRRRAGGAPGEDHFGHLDPANPLWAAVIGVAAAEPRAHAEAADAADPLAGFRDRFVAPTTAPDLPRRQLARPAAARHARPARRAGGRVGRAARRRLAGLDRRARARRRRDRGGDRRRARRGASSATRRRSTCTSSSARRSTRAAGGALVTDRGNFPTDRYVLEGIAAAARPRAAAVRRRARRPADASRAGRATSSSSPTSPTAPARWPTCPRSGRSARARRDADLGPQPLRRRGARRPARRGRRAGRRLHLQVPQRRARARPAYLYVARGAAGGAALADLGLVRPARPVRDGARLRPRAGDPRASSPARRRSSASPPSRRACG